MLQTTATSTLAPPESDKSRDRCITATNIISLHHRVSSIILVWDNIYNEDEEEEEEEMDDDDPHRSCSSKKKKENLQRSEKTHPPLMHEVTVAMLWRVLALCDAAERRAERCVLRGNVNISSHSHNNDNETNSSSSKKIPAALEFLSIDLNTFTRDIVANTPIFGPLTSNYPALARSLQVVTVSRNAFDESADLAAFAALATHLKELRLLCCGISSIRGLAGRCDHLSKVDFCGCKHLSSLAGLEHHARLEEVVASYTPITSVEPLLEGCAALKMVDVCDCRLLPPDIELGDGIRVYQ